MHAQIQVHFEEENAAFDDSDREVERLVDEALDEAKSVMMDGIPPSGVERALVDINGNTVGRVEISTGL